MKQFVFRLAICVFTLLSAFAWSDVLLQATPAAPPVSASRPHAAKKHHAHKAAKHHRPKHPKTV
ncbi:MAG: hypothetical protein DMG76_05980 [Acidobacteria bacterium]|jgi:hypothetical protein|nr:MAG: hypothetical protein DMG76_05980 [Acidobacteriota bacterium]